MSHCRGQVARTETSLDSKRELFERLGGFLGQAREQRELANRIRDFQLENAGSSQSADALSPAAL